MVRSGTVKTPMLEYHEMLDLPFSKQGEGSWGIISESW